MPHPLPGTLRVREPGHPNTKGSRIYYLFAYLSTNCQSGCPIRSLVPFGSGSPGILIQKGVAFNIITYLPDNLSLDAPAAPWYPSGPGARAS